MIEKVGILFLENGKLLLTKSKNMPTYQIIEKQIKSGETPLQTLIRICHEELGNKAIFDEKKFEYAFDFTSKQSEEEMHMLVFKYNGILTGEISLSNEIEKLMLFGIDSDYNLVSSSLRTIILPYCINNGLIKMVDFNKIKTKELTNEEKYIKDITKLNVKLRVKKGVYNELL